MDQLNELQRKFKTQLAKVNTNQDLQEIRREYLGKASLLTEMMMNIRNVPNEEKKAYGDSINSVKNYLTDCVEKKQEQILILETNEKLSREKVDLTLPSFNSEAGIRNPYWQVYDNLLNIFVSMGFEVYEGDDVETEFFNFTALNTPKNHPARDMQDSFYINKQLLLRSHTSAAQSHKLKENPNQMIKIVTPGKAYRRDDDDMTHSHQFSQMECLVVGTDVHMGHLKNTIETFLEKLFDESLKVRMRSSYFPFTEPSVEVDMTCFKCGGKGCQLCKGTGFIEIMGAGMVHPNVLKMAGFNPNKYQGFAFGVGIERLAMLKYGIDDIRRFYQNDLRFIKQFNKKVS